MGGNPCSPKPVCQQGRMEKKEWDVRAAKRRHTLTQHPPRPSVGVAWWMGDRDTYSLPSAVCSIQVCGILIHFLFFFLLVTTVLSQCDSPNVILCGWLGSKHQLTHSKCNFSHGKFRSPSTGKASCDSRAPLPTVHAGCFSVSIIHWTLTWTKWSLTCAHM